MNENNDNVIDLDVDYQREITDESTFQLEDQEFIEYYARQHALIEAERRILEDQHAKRIKAIARKHDTLTYLYGQRADLIVRRMIAAQKRGKSFDTPYGRYSVRDTSGYVRVNIPEDFVNNIHDAFDSDVDADIFISVKPNSIEIKKRFKVFGSTVYFDGEALSAKTVNKLGLDLIAEKSTVSFTVPKTGDTSTE